MNIKIYGTGTSGHQMVYVTLQRYLEKAEIQFQIEEINNVDEFLRLKIESIPAILVDNSVIYTIRQNEGFNFSLRKALFHILKEKDFGRLTKVVIPFDFSDASLNTFYFCQRLLTGNMAVLQLINMEKSNAIVGVNKLIDIQQERQTKLTEFGISLSNDWSNDLLNAPLIDTEYKECLTQKETILNAISGNVNLITLDSIEAVDIMYLSDTHLPILIVPPKARFKGMKKVAFYIDGPLPDLNDLAILNNLLLQYQVNIHIITTLAIDENVQKELSAKVKNKLIFHQQDFDPKINMDVFKLQSDYAFNLISFSRKNDTMMSKIEQKDKSIKMNNVPLLIL